jgi:hypothetical protein
MNPYLAEALICALLLLGGGILSLMPVWFSLRETE